MSQSRSRKLLEAQAKLIAKEDKKFVAKLSGQRCAFKDSREEIRSTTASPSSSIREKPRPATAGGSLQGPQPGHIHSAGTQLHGAARHRTESPVSPLSRPPWDRATCPGIVAADAETLGCTFTADSFAADEADISAAAHDPQDAMQPSATATSPALASVGDYAANSTAGLSSTWLPYDATVGSTQQQVESCYLTVGPARSSHTAAGDAGYRPCSPSWLQKAAAAGFKVQPGTLQVENSLYANWASTYHPADTNVPAATADTGAGPAAAAGSALAARSGFARDLAEHASSCTPSTADDQQQWAIQVSGAAAGGNPAAYRATSPSVVMRANSPADPRRASVVGQGPNAKYQGWLRQQLPGVKPPKREDTESLTQWLEQQLEQLMQQRPTIAQLEQQDFAAMHDTSRSMTTSPAARHSTATARPGSSSPSAVQRSIAASGNTSNKGVAGFEQQIWGETGLEQQTSQLLLLAQGADGELDVNLLQQQEAIYSAAFHELCRQVSVGCVERGHLMAQLWLSHRTMLMAALEDRQSAHVGQATAHAAAAAIEEELQQLRTLQADEKVALRAISERHAAKAEAAQQLTEQYKQKYDRLQDLLQRLSAAQHLVQRVFDLEKVVTDRDTTIERLGDQITSLQEQVVDLNCQATTWEKRASAAESVRRGLEDQLECTTPRPRRDLGLLSDMLTEPEQQVVEQALVAGVPPLHIHRLLLGLTPEGDDMRQWVDIAGCALQALRGAKDPYQMHQHLLQLLKGCDALGLIKHVDPPESIQLLSTAVHVGAPPNMLILLMDGSLGLPLFGQSEKAMASKAAAAAGSTAGKAGVTITAGQTASASQSAAVAAGRASAGLISNGSPSVQPSWHSAVAAARSDNAQQAVQSFGIGLPYVQLVGVLATKYGHGMDELGGTVTEALAHAQLSTKSRVMDLQQRAKSLHREVVLLKRTLAEQRKHEQERIDAALKDQKRKIVRREARQPNNIDKFLQTKWGDYFTGIGLGDELPKVLRANVPINNKKMPKRDAEKLAKEIWQAKDEQEASTGTRVHLADFTASFLERRFFSIPRLVTEVAYNLIYSLGQHSYDADCNLFLRVFTGDVEEAVRYEQQALEAEVMKLLRLLDVSINHQATGWLHKADVKTALAGFFQGKKVDRLSEIYEALDTDESGEAVHYSILFTDDDDDMNQGMTAEIIRSQHLQERLEFMQEIENVIRDTAEDNQSTSLTPAVLQTCLEKVSLNLPPERTLDEATRDAFVARAFGISWKNDKYRTTLPMGTVIRAIRRGSLQTAMRGPAAATAAIAVSKIQPVGKFKDKLTTALKVGMNESVISAANRERRRTTPDQVGVFPQSAADSGPEQQPRTAGVAGMKSRRATMDAVTAAVSVVLGDKSKAAGDAQSQRSSMATTASRRSSGVGVTQDMLPNVGTEAAAGTESASAATDTTSVGAIKVVTQVPPLPLKQTASGAQSTASTARSSRSQAVSVRRVSAADNAAGGLCRSSVSTSITVGMLSAMEAVRQSWLQEEGTKFSHSGAAAPQAVAAKSSIAEMFSASDGTDAEVTDAAQDLLHQQTTADEAQSGSVNFGTPAVPALHLLDVSELSSTASSVANTARESLAGTAPKAGDSHRPASPLALRPILRRVDTGNKSHKHVHITVGGDSSSAQEDPGSPNSPAGGASASGNTWQDHQLKHQLSLHIQGDDSCAAGAAGGSGRSSSPGSSAVRLGSNLPDLPGSKVRHSSRLGEDGPGSNLTPRASKLSNSSSSRKRMPPTLLLMDADDVIAAAAAASDAASGSGAVSDGGTATGASNRLSNPGSGVHRSSLPGSNSGALAGPLAQEDVCYTPHAPEEGGKINALLMRKLNKGKSLKRLEEVMLMVASQAGDAGDTEEWG